jgi:hypothetical protein
MNDCEETTLIGCCGLYCGLCNKYQSKVPSRCIGCGLGEQHAWCSIWICCVKKHRFKTCTECDEMFDCSIFVRRKVAEWIPAAHNLHQIREAGIENWLAEQKERQVLLEILLQNFNEGRSMNLYCKVCARMPIDLIREAMEETREKLATEKVNSSDMKSKAKVFRSVIQNLSLESNIDLS